MTLRPNINNIVTSFTTLIRQVADPLCSRVVKKNPGFKCKYNDETNKWFDQECRQAKALYKNALHVFNNTRCDIDRIDACRLKKIYKTTIKRAARSYRYKKARAFEKLKKGNPKDFLATFYYKEKARKHKCSHTGF